MLTIGSLFSGIGGLEMGLEWSGLGPVIWQVEKSADCRRVLAHHWPDAVRFDDVCTVGAAELVRPDLVCGGFPCQDLSDAGRKAGLSGARSGLWYEYARVVGELRPRFVVIENVGKGAASKWVDAVRGDLAELGYASLPVTLRASDVGAPHARERIFIVAANAHEAGEHAGPEHAEVEAASEPATGEEKLAAHAVRPRQQGAWDASGRRHGPAAGHWRSPQPPMVRVVHGVSRRSYASDGDYALAKTARMRIAALGNSVVPQCAEVVGHIVRQLVEHGQKFLSEANHA